MSFFELLWKWYTLRTQVSESNIIFFNWSTASEEAQLGVEMLYIENSEIGKWYSLSLSKGGVLNFNFVDQTSGCKIKIFKS